MSVAAWPLPETVSEARALTAAAAHRSLPYLEVSSTKTARRGGQGRGEERGWMMKIFLPLWKPAPRPAGR